MADPNMGETHVRLNYTFDTAIKYMKMLDKSPTTKTVSWKYSHNGNPISIGYSN